MVFQREGDPYGDLIVCEAGKQGEFGPISGNVVREWACIARMYMIRNGVAIQRCSGSPFRAAILEGIACGVPLFSRQMPPSTPEKSHAACPCTIRVGSREKHLIRRLDTSRHSPFSFLLLFSFCEDCGNCGKVVSTAEWLPRRGQRRRSRSGRSMQSP